MAECWGTVVAAGLVVAPTLQADAVTAVGSAPTSGAGTSAAGAWTRTGYMTMPRITHTATLLNDGEVLVAGGFGSRADSPAGYSAELYDPATGTWRRTGDLVRDHRRFTATLLDDGRVLVAGGTGSIPTLFATELFDPATETWTRTGNLNRARQGHTATLLNDGEVLVAGGSDNLRGIIGSAEVFDPATGAWTRTGRLVHPRAAFTATLLDNGMVLAVGGLEGGTGAATTSAERTTRPPAPGPKRLL